MDGHFCNSCGKSGKYSTDIPTGLTLCRRCRRNLDRRVGVGGATLMDVWSSLFRRITRKG